MKKKGRSKHCLRNCYVCQEKFADESLLRTHLQTHEETKRIQCDVCLETFTGKCYLNLHKKLHATKAAENPGKKDDKAPAKLAPKKKVLTFKCEDCSRYFHSLHHREIHACVDSAKAKLRCEVCDRTYSSLYFLNSHMNTHLTDRHTCLICQQTFTGKSYLALHLRSHVERKSYSCDRCEEQFITAQRLKAHKKKHAAKRFFSCDQDNCKKRFLCKYSLVLHKDSHSKEQGVPASEAPKKQAAESSATEDQGISRPFSCNYCPSTFMLQINLEAHHQKYHPPTADLPAPEYDRHDLIETGLQEYHGYATDSDKIKVFEYKEPPKLLWYRDLSNIH